MTSSRDPTSDLPAIEANPSPDAPKRPEEGLIPPTALKPTPTLTTPKWRIVAGNILLAAIYLGVALPTSRYDWGSRIANTIWIVGAVIIGVMTLFRRPATDTKVGPGAIFSNLAALLAPAMMRPGRPAPAIAGMVGIGLELAGVALSQVARIAMGRSFGMMPAHRGIVTRGPFRLVRHPTYLGWLILGFGFATYYPGRRNLSVMIVTIPLVIWRIILEEDLLARDPAYREYTARVPYRLIPFIY
jgi:protein-S-isoprenylcysteine O-methyltransferase Ste14